MTLTPARKRLTQAKRWVVKIGSSSLTANGKGLDRTAIDQWVNQIHQLLQQPGNQLVLVSSGAVAEGMRRLGWTKRPQTVHELQAAAATGQMGLIQAYETSFQQHQRHTAQILLTHDDLVDRQRYLNARSTLKTLLSLGVVPVVNENDTVATDEIRFGDNDTLAALVANLLEADVLVILTDAAGLFDQDPKKSTKAQLISEASANNADLLTMAAGPGALGSGGMRTKLTAARLAARSGCTTVIASSTETQILTRIAAGETLGTVLIPEQSTLAARKQWLGGHLKMRGVLTIDAGAVNALRQQGRSLLSVGVTAVSGNFQRGEMVACESETGERIACGLVNYGAEETQKILRVCSERFIELLGYIDEPELVHRDNMVVF